MLQDDMSSTGTWGSEVIPEESTAELIKRHTAEIAQFDECNPTDAKEFDAQVSGMIVDMLKKRKDPWNRCQECGRFISFADLDSGRARHQMITPDSDVSHEAYETLCRDHADQTVK